MTYRPLISRITLTAALLLATSQLQAFDLSGAKNTLEGTVGSKGGNVAATSGLAGLAGAGIPSLESVGTGNVAGVLKYCLKNKYLGADSAASGVAGKLTNLLGGEEKAAQDKGYSEGLQGILGGNSDSKVDLGSSSLKDKITSSVCDKALKYGSSLL